MSKRQIDLEYLKISAKEVFNICLLVLIVALPGTSFGAASNALTLEQSVEKYTSIVSALQRKNELGEKLIGNYQPWKNPILFVDVREPTKFIGINIQCPKSWTCEPVQKLNGVNLTRGKATDIFSAVQTGFQMIFRQSITSDFYDKNIAEVMAANSNINQLYISYWPVFIAPIASKEYLDRFSRDAIAGNFVILHEGFHLFVQFGSLFDGRPDWQLLQKGTTNREDIALCRNLANPVVQQEIIALQKILALLSEYAKPSFLIGPAKDFLLARKTRYSQTPKGGTSSCERLDLEFERLEGNADYVSEKSFILAGNWKMSDVYEYYNEMFLQQKKKTTSEYAFYFSGATISHLLDQLQPSGEWRQRVSVNPELRLDVLLTELLLP